LVSLHLFTARVAQPRGHSWGGSGDSPQAL